MSQPIEVLKQTRKPPDVAIFMPHLDEGGAERILAQLAGGLSRIGLQTDIVLSDARGSYLSLLPETIHVINLGSSSEYTSIFPLVKYLKAAQPEVILSSLTLATLVMLLSQRIAKVKTRKVVRVANTISLQPRSWLKKLIERIAVTNLYPWADQIVAVSHNVKKDLIDSYHLLPESIQVIYNPTIPPDILLKKQELVDHPWFNQTDKPIIMAIGRIAPQKDYNTLVRAFSLVREQRPVHLVILGKGPEQSNLQATIDQLGMTNDVELMGFISNPYAYLSKASVFCHSAIYEGLVNVLIEAMACDCPVVSTDCPGGPSEILAGGKYGHLVPVGDHEGMAQAIISVLDGDTRKPPLDWLDQFQIEAALLQYLDALGFDSTLYTDR